MQPDNPAARLVSILYEGKKLDVNSSCRDAWEKLLNINSSEEALLMSRLGKLMELPQKIIEIIQSELPEQKETYSYWSVQVNKAFIKQNLNTNWGAFIGSIDLHSLTYLNMTAALIEGKLDTKPIDEDELNNIRSSINEILKETEESDISSKIKS